MSESTIHICPTRYPGDVDAFEELLDTNVVAAEEIQGIMITHEGDLSANAFSLYEVARVLGERLDISRSEIIDTVPIQAMAGAAGFMVPHMALFVRRESEENPPDGKRFVVAGACTRQFQHHEVGTAAYVHAIKETVQELMAEGHIESSDDVHLVFVKTPWPNPLRYAGPSAADQEAFWRTGQLARGGAAIGVGLALGEVDESDFDESRLLEDSNMYSTIAQCSSTEDRTSAAVLLFGNSNMSSGQLVIGHGVLEDGLDTGGVKSVLRSMGYDFDCCPRSEDLERIRYAFVKPKTSEVPTLRGHRHTLTSHGVLGPFWWMVEKAPIHGMVASVLGTTTLEVATGTEHQGPSGQPLLAVIGDAPVPG